MRNPAVKRILQACFLLVPIQCSGPRQWHAMPRHNAHSSRRQHWICMSARLSLRSPLVWQEIKEIHQDSGKELTAEALEVSTRLPPPPPAASLSTRKE